jgi:cystathionine gamma-synthase/methionine-gamma-lyase
MSDDAPLSPLEMAPLRDAVEVVGDAHGLNPNALQPETLAIGFGYDPATASGAAKPPVYLTSTYVYPSAEHAKAVHAAYFEGAPAPEGGGYIYSRLNHPNLDMVERRLAALDRGEDAAVFSSGMAAISAVMMQYLRPGDAVLHSQPIYGGVDSLLQHQMTGLGMRPVAIVDALSEAAFEAAAETALKDGPIGLIMLETPANPTATIADIALAAEIARRIAPRQGGRRPLVTVDNTFLGPFVQTPLAHGADLALTALTKYCGGHSDLLAGGASGSKALVEPLKKLRMVLGSHLDPFSSWLLLPLRTERAASNALRVATFLRDHPKVASITYLGFTGDESAARATLARQAKGVGSTFSFNLKGGEAEAFRMLNRLRVLRMAVSLGGSETLICHPATTTHYATPQARREAVGIGEGTLRVSVGLEHSDDLIADLAQALEAV